MILTMVAMLSMTAAFAEGEKTAEVSNLEAYELNINMNKLSKALGLYDDQKEAVEEIHHTFAAELGASQCHYEESWSHQVDYNSMV